ncbi:MAG: hypothetical protein AAB267_03960, partial [Candidatus Desantisbacteria bacterium]
MASEKSIARAPPKALSKMQWISIGAATALWLLLYYTGLERADQYVSDLVRNAHIINGHAANAIEALKISGLNILSWFIWFTRNVTLILTGLVVLIRFIPYLPTWFQGKAISLEKKLGALTEKSHSFRKEHRIAGIPLIAVDLLHTIYSFGFERSDRLFKIYAGEEVKEPTLTEKLFIKIHYKPIQALLLPVFVTMGLLNKRLVLLLYSTIGRTLLVGVLAFTLAIVAHAFGYDTSNSISWLSSILNFNLLEFTARWFGFANLADSLHTIGKTGGIKGAFVQLWSVFGIASSYILSLIMSFAGHVKTLKQVAKAEKADINILKSVLIAFKDLVTFKAVMFRDEKDPLSIWRKSFKTAFSLTGIHMVGLEIEIFKWAGHHFSATESLIDKIEGERGVLGAGSEFVSKALHPFGLDPNQIVAHMPGTMGMTAEQITSIKELERVIPEKIRELRLLEADIKNIEQGKMLNQDEISRWMNALEAGQLDPMYEIRGGIHSQILRDYYKLRQIMIVEIERAKANHDMLIKMARGEKPIEPKKGIAEKQPDMQARPEQPA